MRSNELSRGSEEGDAWTPAIPNEQRVTGKAVDRAQGSELSRAITRTTELVDETTVPSKESNRFGPRVQDCDPAVREANTAVTLKNWSVSSPSLTPVEVSALTTRSIQHQNPTRTVAFNDPDHGAIADRKRCGRAGIHAGRGEKKKAKNRQGFLPAGESSSHSVHPPEKTCGESRFSQPPVTELSGRRSEEDRFQKTPTQLKREP